MPTPAAATAPYWTSVVPLVAIGLVILRNSRARRLRIETIWVMPVVILALVGLSFTAQGMPTPLMLGLDIAALVIGAALGWWRARFTHISVDPATHQLTSRASPIGMLVILAIFALRYAVRLYAPQGASALGVPAIAIADALLIITVGLVCAQRLELALRATRLLAEARAGGPTSE
jgi:hypothetical protein